MPYQLNAHTTKTVHTHAHTNTPTDEEYARFLQHHTMLNMCEKFRSENLAVQCIYSTDYIFSVRFIVSLYASILFRSFEIIDNGDQDAVYIYGKNR